MYNKTTHRKALPPVRKKETVPIPGTLMSIRTASAVIIARDREWIFCTMTLGISLHLPVQVDIVIYFF
ncbi:hypothetical protein GQ43DRAFT_123474 [Delitschia confertaspora ATCC 74209]|uniref:Uncharacterized protein n=1 Tax=Delitschia confertaspora ATCC 74209 TaxID=1513339 RepID=A0A9P4MNB4_9PLEO|nr:hypothetical protein GQ43DRAFT_123474 [Delitschia confertaspora ATCC 74209]